MLSVRSRVTPLRAAPAIAVGIATFLLLASFVDADPTRGVTHSASPWADEGFNTIAAHNLALLGRLSTDEWNLWLLNLPFTVGLAAVFKVAGAGIVQARLAMIALSASTAVLLGLGLRRPFGARAAAVAAIAFATSILTLYYGRLVYLENLQALALTAGVLTLGTMGDTGERRRRAAAPGVVAGVAFAIAIGTKPNAAFAVAGIVAGVALVEARRSAPIRRWLVACGGVLAVAAALWVVFLALPNRSMLDADLQIIPQVSYPQDPVTAIRRTVGFAGFTGDSGFWVLAPLLVAAALGVAVAVRRRRSLDGASQRLVAASVGWFVVPFALLLVSDYRPNRYLYPVVPALAVLAAPAVVEVCAWVERVWAERAKAAGKTRRSSDRSAVAGGIAAVALAALLAAQGLVSFATWTSGATHDLPAIQGRMAATVPAGAAVVGPDAPTVMMSAPVEVVVPWESSGGEIVANGGDLYSTNGARWYITNRGANAAPIAPDHPAAWAARTEVACFGWFGSTLCLYRLP